MWFLIILSLLNAAIGYRSFLNEYRITVGGLPINVIDGLMALGVLIAPVYLSKAGRFGRHPLYLYVMLACFAALLGGVMMGTLNLAQGAINVRQLITYTRNFVAIPIGVFIGYSLLTSHRAARVFPYVAAIAGCVTATMILRYFQGRAEDYGYGSQLGSLRTVDYVTAYAGIAAGLLVASVLLGARMFPWLVALGMAGYCVIGNFATLSRSDWIATAACVMAVYTCLPRERLVLRAAQGVLAVVVLSGFLLVGIELTSRATGYNFYDKMATRLRSLLPGEQTGVKAKAWDTRLYGAVRELEESLKSPLLGRGFAFQDSPAMADAGERGARHNSWTNAMVETGLVGLTAVSLVVGGCVVVGRRMLKARTDHGSVLMGALGLVTGAYYLVGGLATGAFNNQRAGLHLGLTLGLVLRARVLQLSLLREYEGYLDFAGEGGELPLPVLDAPEAGHF